MKRIDADELLARAKALQRRLYAEDYDEILSYEDLEELVGVAAKNYENLEKLVRAQKEKSRQWAVASEQSTEDGETRTPSVAGATPPPEVEAYGETKLKEICDNYGLTPDGVDFALSQYQKVICELTNGRMSKCTYSAVDIIHTVTDVFCDGCELKEAAYGVPEEGARDE